jgi:xylulose-5-phosphate/fructose-6-phosphate phosphoketolase
MALSSYCSKGIGIWDWASNDQDGEPDVVIVSAGDIPELDTSVWPTSIF